MSITTVAATIVFGTPELLEMILIAACAPLAPSGVTYSYKTMQNLLALQRVNQLFNATIHTSIHLRRILWLEPQFPPRSAESDYRRMCRQRLVNPLLLHCQRRLRIKKLLCWPVWPSRLANPATSGSLTYNRVIDLHFVSLALARSLPLGSWSQMLLIQPSGERVVWSLGVIEMGRWVRVTSIEHKVGMPDQLREFALMWDDVGEMMRLGELRDAVLEHFAEDCKAVESKGV